MQLIKAFHDELHATAEGKLLGVLVNGMDEIHKTTNKITEVFRLVTFIIIQKKNTFFSI